MKKIISIILLMHISVFVYAQGLYNNTWIFGDSVSLSFDCITNQPTVGEFPVRHQWENYANINDSAGNLIMYMQGPDTLWGYGPVLEYMKLNNYSGNEIENGDSLNTSITISTGTIIVPFPNHPKMYYVFYINTMFYLLPGMQFGLSYSIVDMNLNGGLGKVIEKNTLLIHDTLSE